MEQYPIRGWLQGLVEGSATLDETEQVVKDFLAHAKYQGWQEGYKVATGYGHEANRKGSLAGREYLDKEKIGGAYRMAREIRFRAFIKNLKWMVPVENINFSVKTVEADLSSGTGDYSEYEFNEVELMQYTGLKDKSGKKIYEGDVFISRGLCMAVVEWEKGGRFLGFTIGNERKIIYVDREPMVEVIGNIFENPELLEEKQ